MRTIAIVNQKGGVGKTCTSVNLAAAFAELKLRTLVCDLDPQGATSSVFLEKHEALPHSMADVFAGTGIATAALIQPTAYPHLWIIPADDRIKQFDATYGYEIDPRAHMLRDALSEVEADFDVVLFDCPPQSHLTTFAALVAASWVLIPVEAGGFAVRSMTKLRHEIDTVRERMNPSLVVRGYFLSRFKERAATQKAYRDLLAGFLHEHDDTLLTTAVPELDAFHTAISLGKPILAHSPRSKGATIFRQFAKELLAEYATHDHRSHGHKQTRAA